jgi:hypothetical protein
MSLFPPLEPDRRPLVMGGFPSTREEFGPTSSPVMFDHGGGEYERGITLEYLDRADADVQLIRDHHAAMGGSHKPFLLSAEAGLGITDELINGFWTYLEPPQEEHKRGGLIDVTVRLVSL